MFQHNPEIIFTAAGIGLALYASGRFVPAFTSRWLIRFLVGAFLAFLVWGYFRPAIYYFQDNIGTQGDNYMFMSHVARGEWYIQPQHMVFPWIVKPWEFVLKALSLLKAGDAFYLEKLYVWAAFPTKVVMTVALLALLMSFYRNTRSWMTSLAVVLTMAVTYGCWTWAIEPNALGWSLAVELLTCLLLMAWTLKRSRSRLFFGTLGVAACAYTHLAASYFCVGAYLYAVLVVLIRRHGGRREALVELLLLHGTLLAAAIPYWHIMTRFYASTDLRYLLHVMSDYKTFEPFGYHLQHESTFLWVLKENIMTMIRNLTNHWDVVSRREMVVVVLQLGSFIALLISLAFQPKALWRRLSHPVGWLLLLTTGSVLGGFLLRNAGTHYEVVATIPNALLWLYLLFFRFPEESETPHQSRRVAWVLLFAFTTFLHNGFSSWRVLRGGNVLENEYYAAASQIQAALAPQQEAYVFKVFEVLYVGDATRGYYRSQFSRVHWLDDAQQWGTSAAFADRIRQLLKTSQPVYVDEKALSHLGPEMSKRLRLEPVSAQLWRIHQSDKIASVLIQKP